MQANTSKWIQRAVKTLPLALFLSCNPLLAAEQNSFATGLPGAWRAYAADMLSGQPAAYQRDQAGTIRRAIAREIGTWQLAIATSEDGRSSLRLDAEFAAPRGNRSRLVNDSVGGLAETQLLSAWTQRLSSEAELSINGVFAHQTFATPDMLYASVRVDGSSQPWQNAWEHSTGVGLGFSLTQPISSWMDLRLAAQSRIEMESFQRFRGVFNDPGKFDIPSSLRAAVDFRVSANHVLGFGVDRVAYSSVEPFSSADLPDRFLSLLGDAGSPTFAWRDLTVYSLRWQWLPDEVTTLEVRYSTRLQPDPTSDLLRRALSTEFTDRNFGLSLARDLSQRSELSLSASYSPYPYFLGPSLYRGRSVSGNQVELEAVYRLSF
jgi:hypothetical protein